MENLAVYSSPIPLICNLSPRLAEWNLQALQRESVAPVDVAQSFY
jgi:hypothetical protein